MRQLDFQDCFVIPAHSGKDELVDRPRRAQSIHSTALAVAWLANQTLSLGIISSNQRDAKGI
jgi:hypothetical protein